MPTDEEFRRMAFELATLATLKHLVRMACEADPVNLKFSEGVIIRNMEKQDPFVTALNEAKLMVGEICKRD